MPGLAEQRLTIRQLEQSTAINRSRLVDAFRTIDPPVDPIMVAAGSALIVADLVPGVCAIAGLFFRDQRLSERRNRFTKVFLEAPRIVHSLRRLLG